MLKKSDIPEVFLRLGWLASSRNALPCCSGVLNSGNALDV